MDESMKREIEMVKQRDRCEDCVWRGNIARYCDDCRLAENGLYFNRICFCGGLTINLNKPIV